MTAEDRILRVLLQLKADTADAAKVTGALKEVEGQTGKASQSAAALGRELAKGTLSAQSLATSAGALGDVFAVAGLAAFAIFNAVSQSADEMVRLSTEVKNQSEHLLEQEKRWVELAAAAENFGDVINLAEKAGPELAALHQKLDQFRAIELSYFQQFIDAITAMWSAIPGHGPRFGQDPINTAVVDTQKQINDKFLRANADIDTALKNVADLEEAKLGNIGDAIDKWKGKVADAKATLDSIDRTKSPEDLQRYIEAARHYELEKKQLEELQKIDEKRTAEAERRGAALERANRAEEAEKRRLTEEQINASLRDQQTLLQSIHQQQQLIGQNPFLSQDTKQGLTLASMTAEMIRINAAIEKNKADMANSILDPVQHARLQAAIQRDTFELNSLQLKMANLTKPLGAELAQWVNSFGTSAHQIANLIEGSIGAALQGVNQLLIDAAFQTGDWRQTLVGVEKQILNLFLTWLEQMALQKAAQLVGITTTTAAQAASGATIATAHAPAAAATSVSSYGAAAIIGEVLAIAAIASIIAAITGGFREGGYTGDGSTDGIAGVVHKGEYVFPASVTRTLGAGNLAALHRFAEGGDVGPWEEPPPLPGNIGRRDDWVDSRVGPQPNPWYNPYNPYGMPENYTPWYHDLRGTDTPSITAPNASGHAELIGYSPSGEAIYAGADGQLYNSDGSPRSGSAGPSNPFGRGALLAQLAGIAAGGPGTYFNWNTLRTENLRETQSFSSNPNLGGAYGGGQGGYDLSHMHSLAAFASGGPSGTDTIPAWLSPGEFVLKTSAVSAIKSRFGAGALDQLNAAHFAGGGSVGSPSGGGKNSEVHIFNFTDVQKLMKAYMESSAGTKIIVETVGNRRHDLGMASVNA